MKETTKSKIKNDKTEKSISKKENKDLNTPLDRKKLNSSQRKKLNIDKGQSFQDKENKFVKIDKNTPNQQSNKIKLPVSNLKYNSQSTKGSSNIEVQKKSDIVFSRKRKRIDNKNIETAKDEQFHDFRSDLKSPQKKIIRTLNEKTNFESKINNSNSILIQQDEMNNAIVNEKSFISEPISENVYISNNNTTKNINSNNSSSLLNTDSIYTQQNIACLSFQNKSLNISNHSTPPLVGNSTTRRKANVHLLLNDNESNNFNTILKSDNPFTQTTSEDEYKHLNNESSRILFNFPIQEDLKIHIDKDIHKEVDITLSIQNEKEENKQNDFIFKRHDCINRRDSFHQEFKEAPASTMENFINNFKYNELNSKSNSEKWNRKPLIQLKSIHSKNDDDNANTQITIFDQRETSSLEYSLNDTSTSVISATSSSSPFVSPSMNPNGPYTQDDMITPQKRNGTLPPLFISPSIASPSFMAVGTPRRKLGAVATPVQSRSAFSPNIGISSTSKFVRQIDKSVSILNITAIDFDNDGDIFTDLPYKPLIMPYIEQLINWDSPSKTVFTIICILLFWSFDSGIFGLVYSFDHLVVHVCILLIILGFFQRLIFPEKKSKKQSELEAQDFIIVSMEVVEGLHMDVLIIFLMVYRYYLRLTAYTSYMESLKSFIKLLLFCFFHHRFGSMNLLFLLSLYAFFSNIQFKEKD